MSLVIERYRFGDLILFNLDSNDVVFVIWKWVAQRRLLSYMTCCIILI